MYPEHKELEKEYDRQRERLKARSEVKEQAKTLAAHSNKPRNDYEKRRP